MCEFPVIIEQDEDGFFVVHCPDLRGCWSQGGTREEALANIREAREGWLEAAEHRRDAGATPRKTPS